ncbi:IucA/IucC family protein [Staphylococcus hominis]|uniref:IucA/IucC family protein n=1 Tax=Staphylococcus hominis TaxID=1290 RepID=UPI00092685C1|nr:IucA/IucC family protein [Staphylococcus hominis]SIJ24581.1 Aerobactin synthase IucA [Mycobacteroides abscessus subsp. abscessus]MCI2842876.1 siderophore synthetase [Staphylococcus hominis]MCI2851801.1 siderophore synthetase [Staphylococcus hominis]MCI2857999.1 siderophore synthetase [Staphylococcus hominis]MCI2899651.1 siderophore synthetase [Staphylococcus hominis]
MLNEWKHADRNMQYRVVNALIKENIWTHSTTIFKENHYITIEFEQVLLNVHYKYESALSRYEFDGPIIYMNHQHKESVDSLENLLDILVTDFHIDIPFHLKSELIHSRDSFIEVYKEFDTRHEYLQRHDKYINDSERLNFFTWLEKLKKNNDIDDVLYSESLIFEGHPTHPLTKTKLPLSMEEVRTYSPEFEKIINLKVMLIHNEYVNVTTILDHSQFILNEVIPEYLDELHTFMNDRERLLKDYKVILVHPWQYEHTIRNKFKEWLQNHILISTPFHVPSKATSSFRTMSLINHPYHVKLPVNVQATSAVRTVSPETTIDGPKLSQALHRELNQYTQLDVVLEPYGLFAKTDSDDARQLACIIREKPFIKNDGILLVTGALVNKNVVDNEITVDSYLKWINDDINQHTIHQFMRNYTRQLVTPLLALIQDYGIALEAHMQNTLVHLGPKYQIQFIVRDLGGSRIDIKTLSQRLKHIEVENKSLLADSIEEVIMKFQHAVVQNQLAELIFHFKKYEFIKEEELFNIIQEEIEVAINDTKPHADTLRKVLFGPTITVKALLKMRMKKKVKKYLNISLDNPIKREVN